MLLPAVFCFSHQKEGSAWKSESVYISSFFLFKCLVKLQLPLFGVPCTARVDIAGGLSARNWPIPTLKE